VSELNPEYGDRTLRFCAHIAELDDAIICIQTGCLCRVVKQFLPRARNAPASVVYDTDGEPRADSAKVAVAGDAVGVVPEVDGSHVLILVVVDED
jgi:hypothetical protein